MFPGYLALLPGPDEDEVGDRSVRLDRIGLNPKDDIFDPEFFGGDPGGQQGDCPVAGGEGRVGQIDAEKTEAARPVFLDGARRRPKWSWRKRLRKYLVVGSRGSAWASIAS